MSDLLIGLLIGMAVATLPWLVVMACAIFIHLKDAVKDDNDGDWWKKGKSCPN